MAYHHLGFTAGGKSRNMELFAGVKKKTDG
jgi:hypothetical protein